MSDEPKLRRDTVTGRWMLIAPERARRPMGLSAGEPQHRTNREQLTCPFCAGQEGETTSEVLAYREPGSQPNGPGWQLRVVPNMYPAVRQGKKEEPQLPAPGRPTPQPPPCREGEKAEGPNPPAPFPTKEGGVRPLALSPSPLPGPREAPLTGPGTGPGGAASEASGVGSEDPSLALAESGWGLASPLFSSAPAIGRAEVVIECPQHVDSPIQLTDEQFRDVFRAYRERMIALAADPHLAYAAVFKNVGAEAGASLAHTHSQIIAMPVVPELIQLELTSAEAHLAQTGRCVFCALAEHELADGSRVVARSEHFVVITAYAPRFAYEMWVLPIRHQARYESITNAEAMELARLLKRVLRALDATQNSPAYNWFIHTTPLHAGNPPYYHWHLEILPRTARPAGLEWGHGCHITTVAPESAAGELRAALEAAG